MNDKTLLADARTAIKTHGWNQFQTVGTDGSLCAMGGLYQGANPKFLEMVRLAKNSLFSDPCEDVRDSQSLKHLADVIKENYPERVRERMYIPGTVSSFNDHPDTTVDDVFAMMEKAEARVLEEV